MRLQGRIALVTECGAGETYGVVWARALVREGASVMIADRDAARAASVARELGAASVALDVASQASCDAAVAATVARFGGLDVLVNAHHLWHELRADDPSDAYLHHVLDVNAVSIVRTARAALPAFRTRGGGRIVSLSSIGAWQVGDRLARRVAESGEIPGLGYPASKVLENGLTRLLAGALGQFGVTVNAIAPGMIASPATLTRLTEAEQQAFVARTALRRMLRVEDTVGALLHLASDDAARTTGQVLVVDAGLVMLG